MRFSCKIIIRVGHLHSCPPDSLHGEGDGAGEAVSNGEVEHKEVHICPAPWDRKQSLLLQAGAELRQAPGQA